MKLVFRLLLLVIPLVVPGIALADLDGQIKNVLQDKLLRRATVGIEVDRLGASPGETPTVYEFQNDKPLVPASNLKLVTTSAALEELGPDFRFRTKLIRMGQDLAIVGDGDPTFGDAEFLKRAGWGVTTVFENWTAQIQKLKIDTVRDVLIDDSVFEEKFVHPHWPANQLDKRYVAGVAGLNLNANCIDFNIVSTAAGRVVDFSTDPGTHYVSVKNTCMSGSENAVILARDAGTNQIILKGQAPPRGSVAVSITINDPPLYAGTVFSETLAKAGIKLTGTVRRDRTLRSRDPVAAGQGVLIGIHETPIATVLARANKDSMNLYAESLCKRLGAAKSQGTGTWENGTAAIGKFLEKAGAPAGQFTLDDGSGLSKQNAVSTHVLCRVLIHDYYGPNHQTFSDSLSIAGVDGTLDDRFRGSDLRRRIFGKSGFVEGVSSLSGYLRGKDGGWYVFSIIMNGIPHLSNSEVKLLQERIVQAVDATTANSSALRD